MVVEVDRPRVGDRVHAKGGLSGIVFSVKTARDVLMEMDDVKARLFGDNQRSKLGNNWLKTYYRVAVEEEIGKMTWVECHDIEEVTR